LNPSQAIDFYVVLIPHPFPLLSLSLPSICQSNIVFEKTVKKGEWDFFGLGDALYGQM